jgi:hypothetical protein
MKSFKNDDDLLKNIFLNGKSGHYLINISQKIKRLKDLKIFEKIFEKFKNICFSFEILFCTYKNCKILCYWEYSRQCSLGYGSFYKQSLSEISMQILREVGRKKKGMFQTKLSKGLGLTSGEFGHHAKSLVKTGLIQKNQYFSKFLSSFAGLILLKSTYLKTRKKVKINFLKIFEKFPKKNPNNLVLKSIKIFVRAWFFIEQKDLKYGIFYDLINFKNIDKKKIHRTWQKIRLILYKTGVLIENNKIKIKKKSSEKGLSKELVDKFFKKKYSIVSNGNQEKLLLMLKETPVIIIQNIMKKIKIPGISTPKLIEKTRGYIDLKNIQSTLKNFEKYHGFLKFYQQIGRQRILNYYNPNILRITDLKDLESDSVKIISDQNTKRKILLLKWIKSYILPVKDLGKKIALYEKKGLTKVDIKVIRRILSDLIKKNKLKIIKIYSQTNNTKPQEIEYVMKRNFKLKNLKMFPSILDFSELYYYRNPNNDCYRIKKESNITSDHKIFLAIFFSFYTHAMYTERPNIYRKPKKNEPFDYLRIGFKINRCFLLTKKTKGFSDLSILKLKKKKFNFIQMVATFFRHISNFFSTRYFLISEKYCCLNVFIEKKKQINKKKSLILTNDFFFIFLKYFFQKIIFHIKVLIKKTQYNFKKKFYEKKSFCNKRFVTLDKNSFYIYFKPLKKIFSTKKKVLKQKYQKIKIKWGSQFDVNILENYFSKKSRKKISELNNNKKIILNRRLKGLMNLSNIKIALYLFKKINSLECSKLFCLIFRKFSFTIKKALEYPDFSLFLNFTKIDYKFIFNETYMKTQNFFKNFFEIYLNTNQSSLNSCILKKKNYFFLNLLFSRIYSSFGLIYFKKNKKTNYIKNSQNKKIFEKQNNKINRFSLNKIYRLINFFTYKLKKNRFFRNFQTPNTFIKILIIKKQFIHFLVKYEKNAESKFIKRHKSKFGSNIEIRLFQKKANYEIFEQKFENKWNQKINFLPKKYIPKKLDDQKTKVLFGFFKKSFSKQIHLATIIIFKKKCKNFKKNILFNKIFCKIFYFSKKICSGNLKIGILSLKNRTRLNLKRNFYRHIFLKKFLSKSSYSINSFQEFFAKNFSQSKILIRVFFNFLIEKKIKKYNFTGTKFYGSVFFFSSSVYF